MTLEALFNIHAAASLDKQFALDKAVGTAAWQLDLDTGRLRFGNGQTFHVQLLGTESHHTDTWLWSWANPSIGGGEIVQAAEQLREYGAEHGIAELTEPELPLERAEGHYLAMVATGLRESDAYYRAPYEGGAAFLLLTAPELRRHSDDSPMHLHRVFTQLIASLECSHRPAFEAYLRYKGYSYTEAENEIRAQSPRGEKLTAVFDPEGRLTELQFAVTAVPETPLPAPPWWKLGK
jgi:hypothetical protein